MHESRSIIATQQHCFIVAFMTTVIKTLYGLGEALFDNKIDEALLLC